MVLVDTESYCDADKPEDPDCPEDPEDPETPEDPEEPEDPTPDKEDPKEPEKPDGNLPKTGGIPLADMMLAGLAAMSGGAYIAFRKRKK
jgi:LPXTG-motif cell wall-anchored protein